MKCPFLVLPSSDDGAGRVANLASRIGLTIFGLLFAAGPTFMIFLMARSVPDIRAASAWTETRSQTALRVCGSLSCWTGFRSGRPH